MGDDAPTYESAERLRQRIDTTRAHPARVYDVFLGGKDNYAVDREAAKAALAANPRGYLDVRHNRDFLRRAVGYLASEAAIRQFLDIGTGLPTQENVHQIAQRIAPESRVVYVDNDPVVLTHARALLAGGPAGRTDYIDADLRDPAKILQRARQTLDFERPVALVLVAILHFIEDAEAYDIVKGLVAALPSGSYLVLSHLTEDLNPRRSPRSPGPTTSGASPSSCAPGTRSCASSPTAVWRWSSPASSRPTTGIRTTSRTTAGAKP